MFIRNAWYIAAEPRELTKGLVARTVLGERLVIYKTASGLLRVLQDRCPHRLAPLSLGKVVGENLRCAYHGAEFGPDGRCARIPGQAAVPGAAAVRSFPAIERHGYIWVWLGDPNKCGDESSIPEGFAVSGDPNWIGGYGHFESIQVRASEYDWTIPAHRHPELHQFQLLTSGAMTGTLDGERHDLIAPVAVMVAPCVVHGFVYEAGSEGLQVTVPRQAVAPLSSQSPAIQDRLANNIVVDLSSPVASLAECSERFEALGAEFAARREGRRDALQAHVILLALWFFRNAGVPEDSGQRDALRDTLVQRFRSLVELHFLDHRPLSFFAESLGVTAVHLSRVCRTVTRAGAIDLLHERVLLEGRRMLLTGSSVTAIAAELGFSDSGHFSRFFKSRAGMSPSQYRNAAALGLASTPSK